MATFDENGNYIKTDWKAGDKITAAKLNKIEESIEAVNNNDISRHVEADARLDKLESGTASDKQAINAKVDALEDVVEANKDAADLEIYSINQHMTLLDKKIDDGVAEVEAIANTVDGKIAAAETNMNNKISAAETNVDNKIAAAETNVDNKIAAVEMDMQNLVVEVEDNINRIEDGMFWLNVKCPPKHLVEAKADMASDDSDALQAMIDYLASLKNGGTLVFPQGTYWISKPLIIPEFNEFVEINIVGEGENTVIRALAEMDELLLLRGRSGYIKNITFNGSNSSLVRCAKYGIRCQNIMGKNFSGVRCIYNKLHGLYIADQNNNLCVFRDNCKFDHNGTLISNVSCGAVGDTLTLNSPINDLYIGAYMVHNTKLYQVKRISEDKLSITVEPNMAISDTITVNFHLGNGFHAERGSDNNVYDISNCHFVDNVGAGLCIRGLYGSFIKNGNFDLNQIAGIHIGSGVFDVTPAYSSAFVHMYFENNGYANIILDYPSGLSIIEPLLSPTLVSGSNGLNTIYAFNGYYFDYDSTSIIYKGSFYKYVRNWGNEALVTITGKSTRVFRHEGAPSTTVKLPAPTKNIHFDEDVYEIFVESTGGGVLVFTSDFATVNGETQFTFEAGAGFVVKAFYSLYLDTWCVSRTN